MAIICSCTSNTSKKNNQISKNIMTNTGLKIEYGPNLGIHHHSNTGIKYFYTHITAIITNQNKSSIELYLGLSKTVEFPTFCNDNTYKVFLLPEELTPDTATVYNNIVNGTHDFLNAPLHQSSTISKTLKANELCMVTIGTLTQLPSSCSVVPRAVFSHDSLNRYAPCEKFINQEIPTNPLVEIGVKLEYYNRRKFIGPEDDCMIIPFGQFSYVDQEL